jgi:excisionase family DNA binding protein
LYDGVCGAYTRGQAGNKTMATTNQLGNAVSAGNAAKQLGVTTVTIKAMVERGELEGFATSGGHRRILQRSINSFLGFDESDNNEGLAKVAVYARCSSTSQRTALVAQIDRLSKAAEEKLGEAPKLYSEIASAMGGGRKVLHRLIGDVIDGKVKVIVVEHLNRFARIQDTLELLNFICEKCGVKVIALDREEKLTEEAEFVDQVLSFLTCYVNKLSSKKAKAICTLKVDETTMAKLAAWKEEGLSVSAVASKAQRAKLTAVDGNGKASPLSQYKVGKLLAASQK